MGNSLILDYKNLKDYGNTLAKALETIDESLVNKLKEEIFNRIGTIDQIFLIGNGGSAANAHHIVGDYSKTFAMIGKCINMYSLADNSCYITAVSNDLDYSEVFELLINSRVRKNDLIIFLSGSGNSMNLVKSARIAKTKMITSAAILGYTGGALRDLVDIPIHVNVNDMEIAEDAQIATFHFVKQKLYKLLSKDAAPMAKYIKRVGEDLIA